MSDNIPKHTKKLKEALEKIGFGLRFCGCEHYLVINEKKRDTEFEIFNDTLSVKTKVFGGYGKGIIHFNLRYCVIEYDSKHNMVSIFSDKCTAIFISFYGDKKGVVL